MDNELIVFSGNSNLPLAKKICAYLDVPMGEALVSSFSDGETRVEIGSNVRGRDVFIIQSTSNPANHHIIEALTLVDACRRASASRITMVCPYFGYARQERKSAPRTPITAKLVSDLFTISGIDRLLVMELHTSAIQGFFNIPVDHLFAKPIFGPYFKKDENLIIISPDAGGVERARAMAKYFGCGLAVVDKRRDQPNESSVMHLIGDVRGKNCLIIDDICDTAGSITKAASALMENGALTVKAAVSHAILSGPAIERLEKSVVQELVVTDSIQLSPTARQLTKITQLSISELLGKAIRRIHNSESISSLYV